MQQTCTEVRAEEEKRRSIWGVERGQKRFNDFDAAARGKVQKHAMRRGATGN